MPFQKTVGRPCIFLALLFVQLLWVGCASTRHGHNNGPDRRHSAPLLPGMSATGGLAPEAARPETPEAFDIRTPDENSAEDEEDVEIRPNKNIGKNSPIPHEFNEKVAEWIRYFSQKDRERFQRFIDRGEPYREAVENILEENKVPVDLYYLGLIESGFSFGAKSRVSAVGVWQFMKGTGKMYGLDVDSYVDERRDPIRATEAAAKYLRDLHREFKSWYLAMAAYNAGPGRIRGCIRRAGTDDFWELVEKKKLPRETMEYIPKFLAARYIGENPDLFAFFINEEKKYPNVELVKVPSPVPFELIEKSCGMPYGTLAFVNPHYLRSFTHPAKKSDQIWVPEKYVASVQTQSASLAAMKVKVKPEKASSFVARNEKNLVYLVKKGDTLKSIASKRGLSVAYLSQVNGLSRKAKLVPGQRLKLSATSYRQRKTHPRPMHRKKRK